MQGLQLLRSQALSYYDLFINSRYAPVIFVLIIAIVSYVIYYYVSTASSVSSLANITDIVSTASTNANAIYQPREAGRKSLNTLLTVGLTGTNQMNRYLINFYILTANMAGLFTPAVNGVYDPSALKYAIRAGARGFIFDIYSSSVEKNYAPVLRVLQPGSNWKVQTINEMPLGLALDTLRKEGFDTGLSDNRHNDPMVLYFRFRGKIITSTLNLTAAAIRATLEGYLVPTSENNSIPHQPIVNFTRKVLIFSNMASSDIATTNFVDYCNSREGDVKGPAYNSYAPKDIINITDPTTIINNNKTTMAICAPNPEDTMGNDNNWMINTSDPSVSPIDNKGINMVGLNFYSFVDGNVDAGLASYITNNNKFGTYSFWMKPLNLQYAPEQTSPPQQNNLPATNGTPRPPA